MICPGCGDSYHPRAKWVVEGRAVCFVCATGETTEERAARLAEHEIAGVS